MAVEKWMTGSMSLWLDTSKPSPVRIKRVDYLPPTNTALVLDMYNRVLSEPQQKYTGLQAKRRVFNYEIKNGLIALPNET